MIIDENVAVEAFNHETKNVAYSNHDIKSVQMSFDKKKVGNWRKWCYRDKAVKTYRLKATLERVIQVADKLDHTWAVMQ